MTINSWKDQFDNFSLKMKRNLGILKRVRNDIPKESLIALYRTMVETTPGGNVVQHL